ncbi:TetR/AcrR family transcriptional regulator [Leifsonia sp. 2MCAF36]|uniref:TetR/AcrR family transcriptional regulator n=1 Tax=Leifsonia sp. 2MCAF36 TaxID=3232988 RepID=UPI003F99CC64
MSPRPYNLGRRHEQIDQGRRQIVDAARALLGEATSYTDFTVNAVAQRADVARGTVYYQFESKTGLLEALCDELAQVGGLADLPGAFAKEDPLQALTAFIDCFAQFWQADRDVMRRLRALAALDPDVRAVIESRDERRRRGLSELAGRILGASHPASAPGTEVVSQLLAVTSFETFDTIAGADNADLTVATPAIVQLARAALSAATG